VPIGVLTPMETPGVRVMRVLHTSVMHHQRGTVMIKSHAVPVGLIGVQAQVITAGARRMNVLPVAHPKRGTVI